jgi:hypothetical protein
MEFVDESGHTFSRNLKGKIKKAQYDPEPTLKDYITRVPVNLRRNEQVQEQQAPKDQVGDEFTIEAKEIKLLEDIQKEKESKKSREEQTQTALEKKKAKEAEEANSSVLSKAFSNVLKYGPTSGQLKLLTALSTQNPLAIAKSISTLAREDERSKRHKGVETRAEKADIRREIADAKKHLEELKAKRAQKKKVVTTHKGQKKTIE